MLIREHGMMSSGDASHPVHKQDDIVLVSLDEPVGLDVPKETRFKDAGKKTSQ